MKQEKTEEDSTEFMVEIKGTRPLLMHSTASMLNPKSNKVKSSEHDPIKEAKECLYLNKDNKICVPSMAILSSMRKAATQLKKPGSGKKTLKDFVYSGLRIDQEFIELPNQNYEVDLRPVVIGRARIMRARPIFNEWGIIFKISILDTDTWSYRSVKDVITEAGKYNGLLDFRPLFGTFEVVSVTPISDEKVE